MPPRPWNAYLEGSYLVDDLDLEVGLRYWRIQFFPVGVHVANSKATLYTGPFWFDTRYYLSIDDIGDVTHSGLLRIGWTYLRTSSVYLGGGAGDRSDFIELRRGGAEFHWLLVGGIEYPIAPSHRLALDLVHRREREGDRRYRQTRILLKYEFRGGNVGR